MTNLLNNGIVKPSNYVVEKTLIYRIKIGRNP